jgi:hypothetical protein
MAKSGGAAYLNNGSLNGFATKTKSSVFVENVAESGGAIAKSHGIGSLGGCTIVANTARSFGGGISGSGFIIENSILWRNQLVTASAVVNTATAQISSASTAQVHYSIVQGWSRSDAPTVSSDDPLFLHPIPLRRPVPLDLSLHPLSPCRDAGDHSYFVNAGDADIEGKPRVLCGRIDRGAFEAGTVGDANCDGLFGVDDLAWWTECMRGPLLHIEGTECLSFDPNLDGRIDLRDMSSLMTRVGGRGYIHQ